METPEPYDFGMNRVNILLLGIDASTERYTVMRNFRTDTILLASIDFEHQEIHLISIPRDSYVRYPQRQEYGRINAAFVYGGGLEGKGFEMTLQTVEDFFGGITIHYYGAVDMNVFKVVVDALGGIRYDVDVPVWMAGRTLEPGLQVLTGQQALDYARNRSTSGGDIQRMDRQQRLMVAALAQLKSFNGLIRLPEIYRKDKDDIHTNLDFSQIASLCLFGTKLDVETQIHRYTVEGGSLYMDGVSYWGIDQRKKQQLVETVFGFLPPFVESDDLHFIRREYEAKVAAHLARIEAEFKPMQKDIDTYRSYLTAAETDSLQRRIHLVHQHMEGMRPDRAETALLDLSLFWKPLREACRQRRQEAEEAAEKQALAQARAAAGELLEAVQGIMESEDIANLSEDALAALLGHIQDLETAADTNNTQSILKKTKALKEWIDLHLSDLPE